MAQPFSHGVVGNCLIFPDPTKINRTERKENQKMAVSSTSTSALSAMHCASSMDSTSAHINLDHSYQTSYHHLKEENENLRREVEELRIQIRMMSMKRAFRIGDIIDDERKMLMYTSLRPDMFHAIDEMMQRFQVK
uniref:Uncharacterized protein n=1 Tax=Magallana gigas TaxID=29159 RepID=A0A8W8I7W4_MAGGI